MSPPGARASRLVGSAGFQPARGGTPRVVLPAGCWRYEGTGLAALAALAALLAACASSPVGSDPLPHGDANYDALKAATQTCEAQGGSLSLKSGYDGRDLANYVCKSVKAP